MRIMLYRMMWLIILPFYIPYSLWRAYKGKEQLCRLPERLGISTLEKKDTPVFWFHASSVGESLSLLVLLERIATSHPHLQILVTTGTRTSAKLMKERLPQTAFHQYLPWDFYPFVKLFLNKWKPKYSFFVESEFWPEMLSQAPNPILLNARISDRSFPKYMKNTWFRKHILGRFITSYGQDTLMSERLEKLGLTHVKNYGNLKLDAVIQQPDPKELKQLQEDIESRPVIVLASSHAPEEDLITPVFTQLREEFKNLLIIIAPRHPHRGELLQKTFNKQGLQVSRRTLDDKITSSTHIYIADTVGEMPLWYALANSVIIGGSFIEHGGQNPYEPLKMGKITITGPHMFNFKQAMHLYKEKDIILQVNTTDELYPLLRSALSNLDSSREKHIQDAMKNLGGAVNKIYADIDRLIKEESTS